MQFHIPRELDKALQKEKSLIDRAALLAGIVGPLAIIPQAIGIWSGSTEGISVVMWVIFLLGSIILITYSILYKLKSMFITQVVWLIMATLILVGLTVVN